MRRLARRLWASGDFASARQLRQVMRNADTLEQLQDGFEALTEGDERVLAMEAEGEPQPSEPRFLERVLDRLERWTAIAWEHREEILRFVALILATVGAAI